MQNFQKKGEKIEIANSLWQYDYGQRIQIEGLNLPEIFEAHFSWKELEKTKIVTGTTVDGISALDIPSETLKQSGVVTIYIYICQAKQKENYEKNQSRAVRLLFLYKIAPAQPEKE